MSRYAAHESARQLISAAVDGDRDMLCDLAAQVVDEPNAADVLACLAHTAAGLAEYEARHRLTSVEEHLAQWWQAAERAAAP